MIKKECQEILIKFCDEHSLPYPKLRFSNGLKKANGIYKYSYDIILFKTANTLEEITNSLKSFEIVISNLMIKFFNNEQVKKTLIHELTHHYCLFHNKNANHTEYFKQKCSEFGGSMNSILAGSIYADSVSDNYITKKIGFKLECQCGKPGHGIQHYIRNPKKTTLTKYCCPICKTLMKEWKRIEK